MKLLSHIFSTSIVQRRGLITFMDATVSPCPKFFSEEMVSLVSSSYEGTFHIGDKEAASTILLVPFLVATVKQLQSITSRKSLVDGEFVVYKMMSRGRNPASDLAIVVLTCVYTYIHTYRMLKVLELGSLNRAI